MKVDLGDLNAFVAVARANGFREGARASGASASSLSEAVRRLEADLGVRLLNRTTRSVAPTAAGERLLARLGSALAEVEAALDGVMALADRPAGTLRLNVPISASRLTLPRIVPRFLAAYPDITLEVIADDSFVDVLAAGCDAGIRYDERLEQDMIAVPIGPRIQRFATAAAPAYLDRRGRPAHPRELLGHACLRGRFASGASRRGNSSATARSCASILRGRCSCGSAAVPTCWSTRRSPASESSIISRTGCARISTAARSNRSSNHGGRASRVRSSITPDAALCPRRCGRSSTSSRRWVEEITGVYRPPRLCPRPLKANHGRADRRPRQILADDRAWTLSPRVGMPRAARAASQFAKGRIAVKHTPTSRIELNELRRRDRFAIRRPNHPAALPRSAAGTAPNSSLALGKP